MRPTEIKLQVDRILTETLSEEVAASLVALIKTEGAIAAKFFAQFEDVDGNPPSVEWLSIFEEAGLLVAHTLEIPDRIHADKDKPYIIPLVGYRLYSADIISDTAHHLCVWLVQHIDKVEFIDWVLTKGGILHPRFKDMITWQMWSGGKKFDGKGQPTPYASILEILTNRDLMQYGFNDVDYYLLEKELEDNAHGVSYALKQKIISLLSPRLAVTGESYTQALESRRKYVAESVELLPNHILGSLFRMETPENYQLKKLIDSLHKKKEWLADIAPDAFAVLKRTFDLLSLIREGHYTYISRPSISPHEQNRDYKGWGILVDLARDSLESLLNENPIKGKALLELMIEQGTSINKNTDEDEVGAASPIFMRIALYALSQQPRGMSARQILELAWRYEYAWLFTSEGKKEAHDLLQKVWLDDSLPASLRKKVISSILRGPIEVMKSRKKEDLQYKKYQIFLRLKWLKEVGGDLTSKGEAAYQKLLEYFKDQKDSPLDMLSSYSESSSGPDEPKIQISYEEFSAASIDQHIIWLKDNDAHETSWKQYNNVSECWRKLFNADENRAFTLLSQIGDAGCWSRSAWSPLGYEIAKLEDKDHDWQTFFGLIKRMPEADLEKVLYEVTWAVRYFGESSKSKDKVAKQDFISAWEHILPIAKNLRNSEVGASISSAINHSLGHLAEALLGLVRHQSNGKRGDISRSFSPEFDKIVAGDFATIVHPKIIFCRSLFAMYVLLPEWTEKNIIPLLDWQKNGNKAEPYWTAFLSNARFSEALIACIKPHMLNIFREDRIELFGESTIRSNLMRVVGILILGGNLTQEEMAHILEGAKDQDKTSILGLFLDRLENDNNDRIKDWGIISDWLLTHKNDGYRGSKAGYRLAKMLLTLDEAMFIPAYEKIGDLLFPIEQDLFLIFNTLVDDDRNSPSKHYLWKRPDLLLSFLAKLTPKLTPNYTFAREYLKVVLDNLTDYKENKDYLSLNDAYLQSA